MRRISGKRSKVKPSNQQKYQDVTAWLNRARAPSFPNYKKPWGENASQHILWLIALIPKANQDATKKQRFRPVLLLNIEANILTECQQTRFNGGVIKGLYLWSMGSISGLKRWSNIHTPIVYHTPQEQTKNKIYGMISVDIEKAFANSTTIYD